jgi:membrane protease YdiL (CAAX protease family)
MRLVNLSIPVFYETTLYSLIFIYSLLAVPAIIAATQQGFTRSQLGITFNKLWLYIPLSVVLGLLLAEGEYLIIRTSYLIPDLSIFNLLTLSVIMIFFVGVVEEIIFRSVLQNRLQMVFGNFTGIIFTSVLFGLMHSAYGNIYEVLYASFVGLFIGFLFYRTRSLPLAALIHGFINVFLFGIIPLLI